MHIVSTTDKKIYFVPRAFDLFVTVTVTDDETNVSSYSSTNAIREGNYLYLNLDNGINLIEGRYYTFRIVAGAFQSGNEIYRGKAYCTNQTNLEQFSINNGQFTYFEDSDSDNQYIYR
tara:strand:+ start:152 stop:505 length:354 start_codon:yes stop_codon:yes gene_type:complete